MSALREASEEEAASVARSLPARSLFESPEEFLEWRTREPWRVLLDSEGSIVLLERWRRHLDVLAIRTAFTRSRNLTDLLAGVRAVGHERGLKHLVSPLLDEASVRAYVESGLSFTERLVCYSWRPLDVDEQPVPDGVELRPATTADASSLARIEEECFSPFWRHTAEELGHFPPRWTAIVATEDAEVIGYTLTTLGRGAGTLGRVAVTPVAQGKGVGRALVSEASQHCARNGSTRMSLCTQESNDASRALYRSLGLSEVRTRLVLAADADWFA